MRQYLAAEKIEPKTLLPEVTVAADALFLIIIRTMDTF